MTNEFTNPDNDKTPNYYDGGVPNNLTPPPPAHDPYGNPYAQSAPQQSYDPAAQYYAQQMHGYVQPPSSTNKNALISLIFSLATFFVLAIVPVVGLAGAIVGVVFGHKALKEEPNTSNSGRGMALTGTIFGYAALVESIVFGALIFLFILGSAVSGSTIH